MLIMIGLVFRWNRACRAANGYLLPWHLYTHSILLHPASSDPWFPKKASDVSCVMVVKGHVVPKTIKAKDRGLDHVAWIMNRLPLWNAI